MSLRSLNALCLLWGLAFVHGGYAWAAKPDVNAAMERYCTGCHNTVDWAGGLDLTTLDPERVGAEAGTWESVVRKLRAGMMPPPGEPRPDARTSAALAAELESRLDTQVVAVPTAPVLHRLNRTEYANAVRDVLGLEVDIANLLPADDASEGFDNVASGLAISPALVQGYTNAAMKLSRAVVGDLTAAETTRTWRVSDRLAQDRHIEGLPLGSRGGVRIEHDFPLDAEYHFSVRGNFALARNADAVIDVALDGKRIEVRDLRDFRLRVSAGRHVLTAAIFDLRRPTGVDDIYSVQRVRGAIESVEIGGPLGARVVGETPARRQVFTCRPASAAEEGACARRILVQIASRAFRAPQSEADLPEVLRFYERGRTEEGFEAGIQRGLARILVDPRFLFRFEAAAPRDPRRVDDLALASRLSFFLWSSVPDQELLDLAVRDRLHEPARLAAQVRRMLADPRSRALVDNFAGQWLHLRELQTLTPEVEGFDENLRAAFTEETTRLVEWVLRGNRPVTELLAADYSFLDERLARHYGIPNVRGSRFRKVALPAHTQRRGLLGHGSILTLTSTATRTSPVIRGSWILENLLSAPVPAPPPGVETNLDGDGSQVLTSSVRARLEAHRLNPGCASCHGVIDPVGFALENFDPIGAWRERDGDAPVDASGTLVDGTRIAGPADLGAALLARSDLFVTTVVERLMTYALGRRLEPHDMPAVRAVVRRAQRDGLGFGALIEAVAQSGPFQQGPAVQAGMLAARPVVP